MDLLAVSDCWHTDAPLRTHCQTRALQPCLPSSLHALASGTEPRKDRGCSVLFVGLFVFVWETREPDELTGISVVSSPGRSKDEVCSNKKRHKTS